jgi:hypothetical protein
MNYTCENCKFGVDIVEDEQFDLTAAQTAVLCHRFPPIPHPFGKSKKIERFIWGWPVIGKNQWCGEYKPKNEQ